MRDEETSQEGELDDRVPNLALNLNHKQAGGSGLIFIKAGGVTISFQNKTLLYCEHFYMKI